MRKITYIFLYLLLFTPLLAYIYTVTLELPKTIMHFYVFFVFAFGLIFIIKKKNNYFPKYLWFLLFYGIYRLAWLQIADVHYHILTHIYYDILNFAILFIILIIYNTHFSDTFIKRSISIIKITVILAVLVSIVQVFYFDFFSAWSYFDIEFPFVGNIYQQRRCSIFGFVDLNEIGLSYIPLAAVFIGFLLYWRQKSYVFFSILIGISVFLTNARYVMFGFVIILLMYFAYFKLNFKGIIKYTFLVLILSGGLYFSLVQIGYDFQSFYEERLWSEGSLFETSRYKAFETFKEFFSKKPIFGTGVHLTDEIREASRELGSSQIHVGYLSHLVSYGLVGSFFLFAFWFMLAKNLYKNAKKTNYWGAFFAYLIFFWAQATLVFYSIFTTGLIFALVFDKYFQDKFAALKGSYPIVGEKNRNDKKQIYFCQQR